MITVMIAHSIQLLWRLRAFLRRRERGDVFDIPEAFQNQVNSAQTLGNQLIRLGLQLVEQDPTRPTGRDTSLLKGHS